MNRHIMYSIVAAATICVTATPLYANVADDKIETAFTSSYVYTTYLKDDAITINAKDGVVTLTGTVKAEYHKALASDTAANLTGVTRVDNKLETEAEADTASADKWIGRKINLNLLLHRNVSAINTGVDVKAGVVTLTGEASSLAQKDLVTEYAGDIDGVKSVDNQMTVAEAKEKEERTPGKKLDDASVTAQVKTALWNHRSTSAVATNVTTRDGEVTLTGICKTAAERSLVTKVVSDIQGVTSVNNEMTIDEVKTK